MQMRVESRVRICRMVVLLAIQWGDITRAVSIISGVRRFHYPTERYGSARRLLRWVRRVAWLVPCAHGTPTMKLWSYDVRSEGPSQATLFGQERASLELGGEQPDRPSCSQRPRDDTAVPRCAQ